MDSLDKTGRDKLWAEEMMEKYPFKVLVVEALGEMSQNLQEIHLMLQKMLEVHGYVLKQEDNSDNIFLN